MIVGMALVTPIKTLTTVQTYFAPLEEDGVKVNLLEAKLVFIALNLLALVVALYKCSTSEFFFVWRGVHSRARARR